MRLIEFASAEEQLGLWKLVSDNMWQAISTQAEQEKLEKAKKAAAAKSTKAKKKSVVRKPPTITVPKPTPPVVPVAPKPKPDEIVPVAQPSVPQGALPSKGPWGATQVPVDSATTQLPSKPIVSSTDAQNKQDTNLKLSAREKGVVRK
jgi:hypothetical protein